MQTIKKRNIEFQFDKKIYQCPNPLFITSDMFWDGGIRTDAPLTDKVNFYSLTEKMSQIVKKIVLLLDDEVFIGKALCENNLIYAKWSDLKQYELFRSVSSIIKKNRYYRLSIPEDNNVIDMILESNFRYFTHISFYLPASKIIIQPTCHSEIIIYSMQKEKITEIICSAIQEYSDIVRCQE